MFETSLRGRIIAGAGANAVGQGITIVIQLCSLPLFLHFWDVQTYGKWLLLSAIPTYLAMTDVGMLYAAGNKMAMAMGEGDVPAARRIFQTAFIFMSSVCGSLLMLATLACAYLPIEYVIPDDGLNYRLALFLLSCSVVLGLFSGLSDSLLRATGRYPLGTMLSNLSRLAEWIGFGVGLALGGNFESVAAGGLIFKGFGFIILALAARSGAHGICWGTAHASLKELKSLAAPAFSFMLFPAAFALSFQGLTIVVGLILGASSVATFNTYRTLARLAVQATSVLSLAVGPEFSRMAGTRDQRGIEDLYKRTAKASLLFGCAITILLCATSPTILDVWTHGRIAYDLMLMSALLLYALISSAAHVPRTLLLSINEHETLANWTLGIALILVAVAFVFGKVLGLIGVAIAMILCELWSTAICSRFAKRALYSNRHRLLSAI